MSDPWDLAWTNLHTLRQHKYELAVLVAAATEPHNLHLPAGQDVHVAEIIARRCCKAAWEKAPNVLLLPSLPFGVECNLNAYPMAIHVSQATLDQMLREIIVSVRGHGVRKFLIVNGHGGNDFAPLVRQIQCDHDVHVFTANWWEIGQDRYREFFQAKDDHAGEMETSIALACYPEAVDLKVAGDGQARPFRFEALEKRWVRTSRAFARLNDHCGVGDPRAANADNGRRYLDLCCERLTQFMVEVAAAEIDAKFPHK